MFENPAKGWHGSYSIVGRSSAEKYHLILIKDLILSGKYKKKKIKNYFSINETEPNQKLRKENKRDIFEEPPIRDKIEKKYVNHIILLIYLKDINFISIIIKNYIIII